MTAQDKYYLTVIQHTWCYLHSSEVRTSIKSQSGWSWYLSWKCTVCMQLYNLLPLILFPHLQQTVWCSHMHR